MNIHLPECDTRKNNGFSNILNRVRTQCDKKKTYAYFINNIPNGIYNIGSAVTTYFNRIKHLCSKKDILAINFLCPTIGHVNPLVQDIDTKKFENTFKMKMN